MNVAAVVFLGLSAVVGLMIWPAVVRRHAPLSRSAAIGAASAPSVLLGVAGLFAWNARPPHDDLLADLGVALGMVAAVTAGAAVAIAVLHLADRSLGPVTSAAETSGSPEQAGVRDDDTLGAIADPMTLRGGAWIGGLERIAVAVSLLARWPEGIAVVLAIKGVGRYPELHRPAASERFIVGTFTSVLWAVAVAGVMVALRS